MTTKINWEVRKKRWMFWAAIGAAVLAAMGVSPEMFTSWGLVWDAIIGLFCNPFQLGCVIFAILGVVTDFTTPGIGDSPRALHYKKPGELND